MGGQHSKSKMKSFGRSNETSVGHYNQKSQQLIEGMLLTNLETVIHHYIPPSFPLSPSVNSIDIVVIKDSWELLKSGDCQGIRGRGSDGMIILFDEFYSRLFRRSRAFEGVFGDSLKARGEVMVRIIEFVITLDLDHSDHVLAQLFFLGRAHAQKKIRPWQFGTFAETLIETIMVCLGDDGSYQVGSAWTRVMAFVMVNMLPEAIRFTYVETEFSSIYSTTLNKSLSARSLASNACDSNGGSDDDDTRKIAKKETSSKKENSGNRTRVHTAASNAGG